MKGNMLRIPAIVIMIIAAILANTGCLQRQGNHRSETPLPKKILVNDAFYEDGRVVVSNNSEVTRILNKETGQEIEVGSVSKSVNTITNKTTAEPPLVGTSIMGGIKLVDNHEIHIIETKPHFKLLSSFPNPGTQEDKIIINKRINTLYFYRNGELYKTYPVATGKEPYYTPEGIFRIVNKVKDRDELKEQLGVCWMGLSVPCEKDKRADLDSRAPTGKKYGIHGTNEPHSIGRHASGGCIRMSNEQAKELFALVDVGTSVDIR